MIELNENTYFTSDTHFCHNKSFLYEPRGFSSIAEHDESIVGRWNSVIDIHDTVVHLGDICLVDTEKAISYLHRLKGRIIWIIGNHDTNQRIQTILQTCPNITILENNQYAAIFKYKKLKFYCSHYPTLTSNFDEHHFSQHLINLHGHTHQKFSFININNPFIYHIGLDSHNCTPININDIITDIRLQYEEINKIKPI